MNAIPNATPAGSALRPLGIGEILDRAVNLCVKHFLPLCLIYVVFMIPFSFVQYYATKDLSAMLQAFADASKAGGSTDPSVVLRHLGAGSSTNPGVLLLGFVLLVLSPLPAGALIEATSCYYFSRPTSFAQAYRVGLSRYLNMLGVSVLFFAAGSLLYLGLILVIVALAFAIGFIYSQLIPVLGIALGVIVGILILAAIFAIVVFVMLALQLSYVMCVVERANFAVAFSRSFVLSLLALTATGGFDVVSVVIRNGLVQLSTPDEMRGRVNAVENVFIGASNELGEFESGMLAGFIGVVPAVVAGGIGTIVVIALWAALFPALRRADRFAQTPG